MSILKLVGHCWRCSISDCHIHAVGTASCRLSGVCPAVLHSSGHAIDGVDLYAQRTDRVLALNRTGILEPCGESGASRGEWLNISLSVARTSDPEPINKLTSLFPKRESAFDSDTTCNRNDDSQTRIEVRRSANGAMTIILGTRTPQSL